MSEPKGSWKGKLWAIFLVWPVIGYTITTEFFKYSSEYRLLIQIGIVLAWCVWVYALFRLLTVLKGEFKRKNE